MNPKERQIESVQEMIEWLNSFANHPKGVLLTKDKNDTFRRTPKTIYSSITRFWEGQSRITNVDDITSIFQKKWRDVNDIIDAETSLYRLHRRLTLDVLYFQMLNESMGKFRHGVSDWGTAYETDPIFLSKLETLTKVRLGVCFKRLYAFTDECGVSLIIKNEFIVPRPDTTPTEPPLPPDLNLRDVFADDDRQREVDEDDEEMYN